ncbi:DUF4347 domain-containing protein [Psychroflexus sp. MES1-P1E]|uniref:DUF4347 domain-containing protein n=1 Tax=Psychroflexus sp. MES1-P1E TaxID=2058320 RepID=UPI0011AE937A|nr:DUF4347 domain-containing protein [Psychroflexus sp. MES1-P1E]
MIKIIKIILFVLGVSSFAATGVATDNLCEAFTSRPLAKEAMPIADQSLCNKQTVKTDTYYIDKDVVLPEVLSKAINNQNEGVFHLFTHGKPGQLFINGKWLEKEAIAFFLIEQFSHPFGEMSEGQSGVNIYGCNFAKGGKGLEALAYLEKQLGISVAASKNITGKDGDWNLEAGNQFFSALAVPNYKYNLQTTIASDDFSSGNSSGGSGWVNNWTLTGDNIFTGGELFMDGGSPFDFATRTVDLSTVSSAQLSLSGRCEDSSSGFESDDFVSVEVSTNGGTSYTTLWTRTGSQICPSDDDVETQNIGPLTLPVGNANTIIRLRSELNSSSEDYYWDDIVISSSGGGPNLPPISINSITTQLSIASGDTSTLNDGDLTQQEFYFANQDYPGTNTEIFNITFNQPSILTQLRILLETDDDGDDSFLENGVQYRVQGFNGSAWDNLTSMTTSDGNVTDYNGNEREDFDFPSNVTPYTIYRILWVGSTSGAQVVDDPWIEEIQFTGTPVDPCPVSGTVNSTNISCGNATGSITISNPTGAANGNYQYRLNTGAWLSTSTFTNLIAGTYSVGVRDADDTSCDVTIATVTISETNNDTDCDGIPDSTDVDDDNDGILDVDEGLTGCISVDEAITSVTTDLPSTNNTSTLFDGVIDGQQSFYFDNNQPYPGSNQDIFNIGFDQQIALTQITVQLDGTVSFLESGVQYKTQGFDGSTWVDLTGTKTSDGTASGDQEVFDLSSNTIAYANYRILWTGGGQVGWDPWIEEILVTALPCSGFNSPDTEGDNIPNHLDLDSDNDGIPDNIEAQTSLGYIAPTGNVGDNGLDSAYENNDSSTATGLTPENTDNADLPDFLDLDSDNDGIFDVEESVFPVLANDGSGKVTGAFGINGLLSSLETVDDYSDVNGAFDDTTPANDFIDVDNDVNSGGDVDYRDVDMDNDGVSDGQDVDADNDGILDSVECNTNSEIIIDDSLIANGDFNQPNGNPYEGDEDATNGADTNFAPSPWGRFDTPDLSTDLTIAFQGNETARASLPGFQSSPSGGSFMGFRDDEGIFGDIIINDPDEELTVRFLYTEYRNPGTTGGNPSDVDIVFRFNSTSTVTGQPIGTVLNLIDSGGTPGTWETRTFTLVPSALGISTAGTYNIFIGSNITDLREIWAFVDNFVIIETSSIPCPDSDGDSIADYLDLDSDNDGIADIIEAGGLDSNTDGRADDNTDTDSDGWADTFDPDNGGAALADTNSDSDFYPDRIDIDSDNDGIVDVIESQPTPDYVAPTGTDADNDGIDDAFDTDGGGAFTQILADTDSDGVPDMFDDDSDGDGESDTIEAYDINNDGVADTLLLGADADNDGLDDAFDLFNLLTTSTGLNPANGSQNAGSFPDTDNPGSESNWREFLFIDYMRHGKFFRNNVEQPMDFGKSSN